MIGSGVDVTSLSARAGAASPLLENLLAYWPLDDGPWSGSDVAQDVVGGYDGADNGTISLDSVDKPTNLSASANFDGTGDRFVVGTTPLDVLFPVDSAWTFALWVKMASGTNESILNTFSSGGIRRFRVTRSNNNSIGFFIDYTSGGLKSPDVKKIDNSDIWHFLAGKYLPGTGHSFAHLEIGGSDPDSQFDATKWVDYANVSQMASDVAPITIGGEDTGNRPFNGRLAGIAVWSGEQSDENLDLFFNGGDGIAYPF